MSAVEQLKEAIDDGIVVFTPPWLGDVLLELASRVEALEAPARPSAHAIILQNENGY